MQKARFVFEAILAFFVGVPLAHAALESRDLLAPADGLVTLDTDTQLEWLDVSATTAVSFNNIVANTGGWAALGFRHATAAEVCALLSAHAVVPDSGCPTGNVAVTGRFDATNRSRVQSFISLFGATTCPSGCSAFDADLVEVEGWFDDQLGTSFAGRVTLFYAVTSNQTSVGVRHTVASRTFSAARYGNWLVRTSISHPPTADAGVNVIVPVGEPAFLNGAGSYDDETPPGSLVQTWSLESRPDGSTAEIQMSAASNTFVPDLPGSYVARLVVTDEDGLVSTPDRVEIVAEIDPAFVHTKLHEFHWHSERSPTGYNYVVHGLSGTMHDESGTSFGTYSYSCDWVGTYACTSQSDIRRHSGGSETVLLANGDVADAASGATFEWIFPFAADDDRVVFEATSRTLDGGATYGVWTMRQNEPAKRELVVPISIEGSTSQLVYAWPVWHSRHGLQLFFGHDGTIEEVTQDHRQYHQWHHGLYSRTADGSARKLVDTRSTVPGTDFRFESLSAATLNESGDVAFAGSWIDASGAWRNGLFRRTTAGELERLGEPNSFDDDAQYWWWWYGNLHYMGSKVYFGGSRPDLNASASANWQSTYDYGIFSVENQAVSKELTVRTLNGLGACSDQPWNHNCFAWNWIDSWAFDANGGVLTTTAGYTHPDNSSRSVLLWSEYGFVRRAVESHTPIGGNIYNWVNKAWGPANLADRSITWVGGRDESYTYEPITGFYESSGRYDLNLAQFDSDRDGIPDQTDNCRERPNADQLDVDGNGIGDVCEDSDADGILDRLDNCPLTLNSSQDNSDGDPFGDACDVCPVVSNPDQRDADLDGIGDACDLDSDNDGMADATDNCPAVPNPGHADLDTDGLGDVCDRDMDGDAIANDIDGRFENGVYVGESRSFSDDFTDQHRRGRSYGFISSRSGVVLSIDDMPDPQGGILIVGASGTGQSQVRQCGAKGKEAVLKVSQGTVAEILCGSVSVRTLYHRAILAVGDDIEIEVPQHAKVAVIQPTESDTIIQNDPDGGLPVVANVGPDIVLTVPPAASGIVAEPEPRQFEIQNSTTSLHSISAIQDGVKFVFEPGDVGMPVPIDIKPGNGDNAINLGSSGVTPVAILSTASFDATRVDPTTVTLASAPLKLKGKGLPMYSLKDVNADGRTDMLVHVDTTALVMSPAMTGAVLRGVTYSGVAIIGTDAVRVVSQ